MEAGASRPNAQTHGAQNACDICGAGFPSEAALRSHQNMAHHRSARPEDSKLDAYMSQREQDREAGIEEMPEPSHDPARPVPRTRSDPPPAPGSEPTGPEDEQTGTDPAERAAPETESDDRRAGSEPPAARPPESESVESPPPNRRAGRKNTADSGAEGA